jgi:nitrogen regulatory protein P-II 1
MHNLVQLSLYIENNQKDDVIDCLLPLEYISGFSLSACFGYSRNHAKLDVAEQVAGGRTLLRVDIVHDSDDTQSIIAALKGVNARHPIRFTVVSVMQQGVVE